MPELPEVETVRRGLASIVTGRRVERVIVLHPRPVRRHLPGPDDFAETLAGRTFAEPKRRGKYLWLPLTDGDAVLAHLGMSGQFRLDEPGAPLLPNTRVLFDLAPVELVETEFVGTEGVETELVEAGSAAVSVSASSTNGGVSTGSTSDGVSAGSTNGGVSTGSTNGGVSTGSTNGGVSTGSTNGGVSTGSTNDGLSTGSIKNGGSTGSANGGVSTGSTAPSQLRFIDQRMFGGLSLSPGGAELPVELAHIGRDLFDPDLDISSIVRRICAKRSGIKRVLLDQTVVSGIGNIYADEALWRAKLHYDRAAETLSAAKVRELLGHARDVMAEALQQGGTSFDALYVNVNGTSGYFERELAVYGREGQACRRCGRRIVREPFMNRSSFRCATCQRRPRMRAG